MKICTDVLEKMHTHIHREPCWREMAIESQTNWDTEELGNRPYTICYTLLVFHARESELGIEVDKKERCVSQRGRELEGRSLFFSTYAPRNSEIG